MIRDLVRALLVSMLILGLVTAATVVLYDYAKRWQRIGAGMAPP
jgi:hypothetical protein